MLTVLSFYLGKKVAFVYRAHREVRGSKIRVIWGKVTRPHGIFPASHGNSPGHYLTLNHRQLGRSTSTIQKQPSSQVFRRIGSDYAVSFFDIGVGFGVAVLRDGEAMVDDVW